MTCPMISRPARGIYRGTSCEMHDLSRDVAPCGAVCWCSWRLAHGLTGVFISFEGSPHVTDPHNPGWKEGHRCAKLVAITVSHAMLAWYNGPESKW